MWPDQIQYAIRCEWGRHGAEILSAACDVVILIDVLSFSTCVEIATTRDAVIFPFRWKDDSAQTFAREVGAELAAPRDQGRFSLSPASFLDVRPETKIVLPSPNGATLSLSTGTVPTLLGCFRNAEAVARAAQQYGKRVAVVPAGERWPDDSLRPCLEDWVGAGALISHLAGSLSPEATAARTIYQASLPRLHTVLSECASGRELTEQGYGEDVLLASQVNVSEGVPILADRSYSRLRTR